MLKRIATLALALAAAGAIVAAQDKRPASPRGTAETQIGPNWIEISYGRPIKRGRTGIMGMPDKLNAGAPVWRAGADVATRLKTPVALQIGGKTVPAGEYSLYIDAKDWTLIVSSWPHQTTYDPKNKAALWGSYGYTPDKDVARVKMTAAKLPFSVDEMTWAFVDVTAKGGKLAIMWDDTVATAPFSVQ
jgi:DUF2911 family protein